MGSDIAGIRQRGMRDNESTLRQKNLLELIVYMQFVL